MTRLSRFTVLVTLLLTLAIVRCGDDGDHYYIPPTETQDPCAGHPSPCFTEDWGVWAYTFWSEETWEWYDVYSDGEYAGLWWWVWMSPAGPDARFVGGAVTDQCRTFPITDYAEIWWDRDLGYYLVEYPGEASGGVEICANDLLISDLWIRGEEWGDITAKYEGKSELPLSVSAEKPGAFVEQLPAIEGERTE